MSTSTTADRQRHWCKVEEDGEKCGAGPYTYWGIHTHHNKQHGKGKPSIYVTQDYLGLESCEDPIVADIIRSNKAGDGEKVYYIASALVEYFERNMGGNTEYFRTKFVAEDIPKACSYKIGKGFKYLIEEDHEFPFKVSKWSEKLSRYKVERM